MSVVVDFQEVGPCVKKLTIEVPQPAVEAEAGRVLRDYVKQVNLPGFRKGKAPKQLILKRFRDEIDQEVADRLVPRYWRQAQAEKSLKPLLPPKIEDLKLEDGAPMTFVASVETSPEIANLRLEDFDLPSGETQPTQTEIDDVLVDIRRQRASWNPVDRPAARGDRVIGKIREIVADGGGDGAAGEEGDEEGRPAERPLDLELVSEKADEELMLALTGLAPGQTTQFKRRIGEGEEAHDKHFHVEIEEVREQELPELDDEFAASLGPFENVEALHKIVTEQLTSRKRDELRQRREHALLDQLRERHPLELPERVVQEEVQSMLREYAENLAGQGVDVMNAGFDWQTLGSEVKPQAERRVHARLLLDAAAKAKQIELDEQRFEEFLSSIASQQGTTPLAVRQHLSENGRIDQLRADLLREQTVRALLGDGEPEDRDEEPQADAGAGTDDAES